MTEHPFPVAAGYDEAWAVALSAGENVLLLAEAAARDTLQPVGTLLAAGCGTGLSAVFLARHFGSRVTGLDPSIDLEQANALAKEFGVASRVSFERGDAT